MLHTRPATVSDADSSEIRNIDDRNGNDPQSPRAHTFYESGSDVTTDQRGRDDDVCEELLSFTGIGFVTAVTLRAEIRHFERFGSGKKLARFCGLTPRHVSSGKRQADAGLVCGSNTALRGVLIQAAQRLPRCEPKWKEFKQRLRISKPANGAHHQF